MWEFLLIAWLNGSIVFQTDYQFESKERCDNVQKWAEEMVEIRNESLLKDSLFEATKCRPVGMSKKGKVKGKAI